MDKILHDLKDSNRYGIFLIMGHAGFVHQQQCVHFTGVLKILYGF